MVQSMVTIANHGSTMFKLWLAMVTIVTHSHHFAGVLAYSHTGASVSPKLCKSPEKKLDKIRPVCRCGAGGCVLHPPSWANYFKIIQFFIRNWVYTPNFSLKIRIFLTFVTPFVKTLQFAPAFSKVCIRAWECTSSKNKLNMFVCSSIVNKLCTIFISSVELFNFIWSFSARNVNHKKLI